MTKPRIIALLVLTALCAMIAAGGGWPSASLTVATLAGLALASAGAHAVNMWYDSDIDRVMQRTRWRPTVTGRLPPEQALALGVAAAAVSFALLAVAVNWLTALLTLGGFLYYVLVYTAWLKRRTPQNIVIGGGAGAFPPLVGWAAVTGHLGMVAALMFLVIVFWTPPHFWALALYREDEYRHAGVPMMPVACGEATTKRQSLVYALLLVATTLVLDRVGLGGPVYLAAAVVLGLILVGLVLAQWRDHGPGGKWALLTFRFSVVYLGLLFITTAMTVRG